MTPSLADGWPEVEFGFELVMSTAPELDGGDARDAARRIGRRVVKLQKPAFRAAPAMGADEGALVAIARPDGAADMSRDVPDACTHERGVQPLVVSG